MVDSVGDVVVDEAVGAAVGVGKLVVDISGKPVGASGDADGWAVGSRVREVVGGSVAISIGDGVGGDCGASVSGTGGHAGEQPWSPFPSPFFFSRFPPFSSPSHPPFFELFLLTPPPLLLLLAFSLFVTPKSFLVFRSEVLMLYDPSTEFWIS